MDILCGPRTASVHVSHSTVIRGLVHVRPLNVVSFLVSFFSDSPPLSLPLLELVPVLVAVVLFVCVSTSVFLLV